MLFLQGRTIVTPQFKLCFFMENKSLPHIGDMLTQYFTENRTYKSALARVLKKHKSVILHYQKRPSLQCRILWELSHALKHNFFQDLADQLPSHFSTNAVKETTENEEIERLKGELNLAKAQVAVLYDIVMGKKEFPKRE